MNSTSNGNKESLFICAQSNEPFSILTIDPISGGNLLAFQGNELLKKKINTATFIGQDQTHLCISLEDKSLITIPMKQKKTKKTLSSTYTRSFLNQKVNFIVSHPSGDFIFISSDNKIFIWELRQGHMLCMIEEHLREISAFRISSCGSLLASGSLDGAVKVWLTASLITQRNRESNISPQLSGHTIHTLEVNDLYISSSGLSARIFSVSGDHSACLYSLPTQQILLKITTDHPLSACCMDGAERRLFLASTGGLIKTIDLMKSEIPKDSFQRMRPMKAENTQSVDNSFVFHTFRIQQLCTNSDGSRLASGDNSGAYAIWDASNGQLLQNGTMKGPIINLEFILESASSYGISLPPLSNLNRQMSSGHISNIVTKHAYDKKAIFHEKDLEVYINNVMLKINNNTLRGELTSSNLSPINIPTNKRTSDGPPLCESQKAKKRREKEKSRENNNIKIETDDPLEEDEESINLSTANDLSTANVEQLQKRIKRLERELARVVAINAEIYDYAANLTIEEENVVT